MISGLENQKWAYNQLPKMTALLEEVVRINSHTANKSGVDAVGAIFKRELQALGMQTTSVAQPDHGDLLLFHTPAAKERGNILLCGHMDTVFPQESGFNWFRMEKGRCFGPGVADMKGGLVVALFALKRLAYEGLLADIPLYFLLNSDEETGSPVSGPLIAELAAKSATALVFECGGSRGQVVTGRKGKLGLRLDITGRAGHAGNASDAKASALLEMAHKIIALEMLNGLSPGLSVNVGWSQGGSGPNVIAEHAQALIDVRLPDDLADQTFQQQLDEIVGRNHVADVTSAVHQTSSRPVMPASKDGNALFERLRAIASSMGIQLEAEFRGGVSDANNIAAVGAAVLDGLGPVGGNDHSEKEYIVQKSLVTRVVLSSKLIVDCAKGQNGG
jgi:glutamate carboxypeptidase